MARISYFLEGVRYSSLSGLTNGLATMFEQPLDKITFRVGDSIAHDVRREALDMLSGPHIGPWNKGPRFPFSRRNPKVGATGFPRWKIHSKSGAYNLKKALHVTTKGVNQYKKDVTVWFDPIESAAVLTPGGLPPSEFNGKMTSGMIDRGWWPELAKRTRRVILDQGGTENG